MAAHPAWPQSQYDQNRAGVPGRWRSAAVEVVTRHRQQSGGAVGAV